MGYCSRICVVGVGFRCKLSGDSTFWTQFRLTLLEPLILSDFVAVLPSSLVAG